MCFSNRHATADLTQILRNNNRATVPTEIWSQDEFRILMKQYYQFEESCQGFGRLKDFKLIASDTRKGGIKIDTRNAVITERLS